MSVPEQLPWQSDQWASLASRRSSGRLPHALLLVGQRGIGKGAFARRFAAWMLCESTAAEPCGHCNSCQLFTAGSHPSLFILQPEEGKRDISIDAVRELSRQLALTGRGQGAKVAIIDPADGLNANGVNALLKTIEEPPPGSLLLLLTDRPMILAATLRSRCQLVRFGVPDATAALTWLQQQAPGADAALLARAHSAPLLAKDWVDTGMLALQSEWNKRLNQILRGDESPLAIAAGMDRDRIKAQQFLQWLMAWALERQKASLYKSDENARSVPQRLDQLLQALVLAQRRLQGNAPAQLTVESVMIQAQALFRPSPAQKE